MSWGHSEGINEIATALAKAQVEINGALKGSTNPHFKASYADLASVWDSCHEQLNKNGIAVVQHTTILADGEILLVTLLVHSSGQWFRSEWPIRPVQNTPQGMGSALTYARRYSLMSMAGVAGIDDDDGNAASVPQGMQNMPRQERRESAAKEKPKEKTAPPRAAWPPPPEVITTIPAALCKGPFAVLAEFDGVPLDKMYQPDLELIVSTIAEHRPKVPDESIRRWFTAIEATATILLRQAHETHPEGEA